MSDVTLVRIPVYEDGKECTCLFFAEKNGIYHVVMCQRENGVKRLNAESGLTAPMVREYLDCLTTEDAALVYAQIPALLAGALN